MADVKWTQDQLAAIEQRGENILVSAAAGSGKTAVLVERILRRIMREGANIDEMLIVTFTNAAAAEMKEKINKRLRAYEARDEAEARHKRRQLACVADADISTIDSFCIKCVRNNSYELNISRDFRICDEIMGEMIIEEAASALLEKYYNSEDSSEFIRLTERYCDQYRDTPLIELLKRIYKFIQDYENPDEKLEEIFRFYISGADLYNSEWAKATVEKQISEINELAEELGFGEDCSVISEYRSANEAQVLAGVAEIGRVKAVEEYMSAITSVLEADRCISNADAELWDSLFEAVSIINEIKKPLTVQLSAKEKKDESLVHAKQIYDECVKHTSGVIKNFEMVNHIAIPSYELCEQYEDICRSTVLIKQMVRELSELIKAIKHKRNSYTFQDIEHMAYELLNNEDNEVARQYRMKYSDIMIDEYQDTNALQDAIFAKISRQNKNIFMVGDLKQSIYAFRGGDPTIFADKGEKYRNYKNPPEENESGVRIDLSANFRSNQNVVNAINSLFEFIMTNEVGDVDYGKTGEKLVCGRDSLGVSEEELSSRTKSEIVTLPFVSGRGNQATENGNNISVRVIEARYIARRIREMIDNGEQIFDGGKLRAIRYSDITVIGASIKNVAKIYSEEFAKENVPIAIPVMGYYDNYEIVVMLSLLRLLVNRRLDAELVTVMRSPIGGFTDEELADISYGGGRVAMYEKLLLACRALPIKADWDDDQIKLAHEREIRLERIRGKINDFIQMLDRFEDFKRYKSVAAIIYDIYTKTHFYDFVGALEDGETAQLNLTLLYEKAKQFSQSGNDSLYGFVKYMEKVSADSDNEKGMSLISEGHNVVRMMTIHGSKGLEFPIVFAIGLGNSFPRDNYAEGIIHRSAGIGLGYRNPEEKSHTEFPIYSWVKDKIKCENRGEDMRKLYVLLTRTRERLICVISKRYDSKAKCVDEMQNIKNESRKLYTEHKSRALAREMGDRVVSDMHLEKSDGFYEWIMLACFAEQQLQDVKNCEDIDKWDYKVADDCYIQSLYDRDVYGILSEQYKFKAMTELPSKTTVSKIKMSEIEKSSVFETVYSMNLDEPQKGKKDKKIPSSSIGTAYHQVMAFIEPTSDMSVKCAEEMIESIVSDGEIDSAVSKYISAEKISGFYKSGTVADEVVKAYKAGRLYRETPFEISINPDVYDNEIKMEQYCESDKILLQGTIDCWFEDENGNCIVIDYKTDKIGNRSAEEFKADKINEYRVQLDLYSEAINMLDGKQVVKRYLYLFAINEFVEVCVR